MNSTTQSPTTQTQFAEACTQAAPWFGTLAPDIQAELYTLWAESGNTDLSEVAEDMASMEMEEYLRLALDVDTDLEPRASDDTTVEPSADGTPVAQEPTHTVKEYQDLLARWEKLRTSAAEANYAQAMTALQAVVVYLGTHPGKAQRSAALSELARRAVETDPDAEALYPPAGKDPVKWHAECVRSAQQEVNKAVQGGAVLSLLYGATLKTPVVCVDGQCREKATKAHPAMPWRRVRELFPLAYRVNPQDEHRECWELLPFVAEACKALVQDMRDGLKAEDVVKRVRLLCVESAKRRMESGDKAAAADLEYWQGKVEKAAAKPESTPAAKATPEAGDSKPQAAPAESSPRSSRPAAKTDGPMTAEQIAVNAWNFILAESRESKVSIGDVLSCLMTAAKDCEAADEPTRHSCIGWMLAHAKRSAATQA